MTLVTGGLAVVAGLVAVASPVLGNAVGGPLGTAIVWLRLPVAGLIMMFVWALLFYALPDVEQQLKFITPGSVMGVVLWVLASWGFSLYVSNFGNYDVTYGSLGAAVGMIVWMWMSTIVILLGAQLHAVAGLRLPDAAHDAAHLDERPARCTGDRGFHPEIRPDLLRGQVGVPQRHDGEWHEPAAGAGNTEGSA